MLMGGGWQVSALNIGMSSITNVELWGMYQGLILAWNKGIRLLIVEVDSLCVTQLIQSQTLSANASSSLVNGIWELLSRNWQVSVHHIYRKANFAADFLATFILSPSWAPCFTYPSPRC